MTQIGPLPGVEVHATLHYYPDDYDVARWGQAHWDVATWPGPAPPEDVSCYVSSYQSSVGRDAPLERFRAGTAQLVVADPAGRYSPWRIPPTATPAAAAVRPGMDVTIWVELDGDPTRYPRFAGRVTSIKDVFETTGYHAVEFDCADWSSILAAYDGLEQSPAGAGETSGARINRICDNAGYTKPRRFDAGVVALQATTLAKNALDEIGLVCDTETGAAFCDPDGTYVHRDRTGMTSDPLYTEVQAVFGEVEPEICYLDLELVSDSDKIKNEVTIANEGGSAFTAVNSASRSLYGRHTYRRLDLIHQNGSESAVTAQRHLSFYAYAANRVESLTPLVTPSTLPDLLPLGLLHRILVIRRATGFQVAAELQIEGIQETITPSSWQIVYTTFSADALFDVARWDNDLWDRGLWGY